MRLYLNRVTLGWCYLPPASAVRLSIESLLTDVCDASGLSVVPQEDLGHFRRPSVLLGCHRPNASSSCPKPRQPFPFPLVQKESLWRRPQLRPAVGWFSQTAERDPKAFQGWLCSGSAWFGVTQHWLEGSPQNGHPGEYPKRFQEQGSSSSLVQGLREPLSRSFSPWHDFKKQNTCMLFYRDLFSHQCQQ